MVNVSINNIFGGTEGYDNNLVGWTGMVVKENTSVVKNLDHNLVMFISIHQ